MWCVDGSAYEEKLAILTKIF